MPDYMPLNDKQLESLPQDTDPLNPKVRFVDEEGRAICIVSGDLVNEQWIYYDRSETFIVQVVRFLNDNNPGHQFRAIVVSDEEVERIEAEQQKLRYVEVPY